MEDTLLEIIKGRRSIREFQKKEIPGEIIGKLIEALIWAPSAGNLQSRKFYFVVNERIKKELAEAAFSQDFIAQAPLVIIGCTDDRIQQRYGQRGKDLYAICDVSVSIENAMLLAHSRGLGSVWVGAFDEGRVAEILGLARNLRPVAIVPVGYPAEKPIPPSRLPPQKAIVWKMGK